jgi:hypothetical protein
MVNMDPLVGTLEVIRWQREKEELELPGRELRVDLLAE